MQTTQPAALQPETGEVRQDAGDPSGSSITAPGDAATGELSEKAQRLYADFTQVVRQSTAERPGAALAIAASVGFVLGALHGSARPRNGRGRWERRD
ncbi:CsbD family protein [Paraburkholderia sp.]|jgi:ElaB/YqjD/DUF883 family membrane-anchored ribosome-binding protein|uniref:CsbD family protein n=1 Tax=Paraburkholderia sp. TaxID=1926495 RepID=UPI002F402349